MEKSTKRYRERIYIIKDIILTLSEYGELNQTTLVSFCGLNLKKHKKLLDQLEARELVSKMEKTEGKRTITIYKPTTKGLQFCKEILDPYEDLFPRSKSKYVENNSLRLILI